MSYNHTQFCDSQYTILTIFTRVTGLARIYINGNLEQEQQQNRGEKLAKNWLVNGIGANFGDDSLHYVDDVIIYDRALTNAEVRMLYNHCTFNRMILHYGFQKGNKTNIADQSGLENNGILIGGKIIRIKQISLKREVAKIVMLETFFCIELVCCLEKQNVG